jgi:2-keto-4-pentenoate hydratase
MSGDSVQRGVDALVSATRHGQRMAALPKGAQPANLDEAHAMQSGVVQALGETVAGWKVAASPNGTMRGAILRSRVLPSPADFRSVGEPMLGIEGEIAFLLQQDLPPRGTDYTAAEVAAASIAMVGIELVGTRFLDYGLAPPLDRTADCMSNLAFVTGTQRPDWRSYDLSQLEAVVRVNGTTVVQQTGGHTAKDPLIPAVLLANALRSRDGLKSGQFITTGTFTGLYRATPADAIEVSFTGFGTASLTLTR